VNNPKLARVCEKPNPFHYNQQNNLTEKKTALITIRITLVSMNTKQVLSTKAN